MKLKRKQKQPKAKSGRRQLKILNVIVCIALVVTIVKCGVQLNTLADLNAQKESYQMAYDNALQEQEKLEENKALLENKTYLERLAKERFHLVKPNEYLVVQAEENEDVADEGEVSAEDIH